MKSLKYFLFLLIFPLLFFQCEIEKSVETRFSRQPLPQNLGVNIHFYEGVAQDWQMIENAGVGIVRMDVSWGGCEKEKGKYDFSRYDALIDKLSKNHIKLLFILDYGNPLYDEGKAPYTDEGRAAFARFAGALAERYTDKEIIWELWNEPNLDKFWKPKANVDDYVKWSQAVSQSIRKADKNAVIAGPAMSAIDFKFMEKCFRQGYLELVDAVTVHPYRGPDRSPETAYEEYQLLQGLIEQYKPAGKNISLLSGEWGYNTTVMPREIQGKYLPRQWLANISAGVPLSIWYDWHDDGKDPKEGEHNFGTVTWDYQPKPAYLSMSKLIKELKGHIYLMRIDLGSPDDFALLFAGNENFKLAYWTKNETHKVAINPAEGENQSLNINDSPQYVSLQKPHPWWAKLSAEIYETTSAGCSKLINDYLSGNKTGNSAAKILLKHSNDADSPADKEMVYSLLIQLAQNSTKESAVNVYKNIINSDAGALNKKQAVYGLLKYGSAADAEIVKSLLKNPQLAADASNCLLFSAYNLARAGKAEQAKSMLLDGLNSSPITFFADRTVELLKVDKKTLNELTKAAGFINSWQVIGPFPYEGSGTIEKQFAKKAKINLKSGFKSNGKTLRWKKYSTENIWGIVPLAEMYGRIKGAAYLYAEIEAPRQKEALFKIGSNDGVVCWLNGKKVHSNFVGRPLTVDNDIFKVMLKKGKNRILLKVLNEGNNWEACMRVSMK